MKKRKIAYSDFLPPRPREERAAPAVEPSVAPVVETAATAEVAVPETAATAVVEMEEPIPVVPPRRSGASSIRGFRPRVETRGGSVDLLLFRVGRELFGVELDSVEEVLDLPELHRIPEMPDALLGVFTLRGALVSLFAPDVTLGVSLTERTSALVFAGEGRRVALAVDDVDDVLMLELSALRDVPSAEAGDGVLAGVVRRDRDLIAVLDVEALLALLRAGHPVEDQ